MHTPESQRHDTLGPLVNDELHVLSPRTTMDVQHQCPTTRKMRADSSAKKTKEPVPDIDVAGMDVPDMDVPPKEPEGRTIEQHHPQ